MSYKSPVLQNSLQLLSEIRSSLATSGKQQQNSKGIKKQVIGIQLFLSYVQFEYEQQEEPRIYPPECIRVEKQVGQVSSANLTEEILDYLRINQKSFEKQCNEIEKQIKELVENIETEDEAEPIQTRKPQKRN